MSGANSLVAVDIGGTHVRFALARVTSGRVEVGDVTTYAVADHAGFDAALQAFAATQATVLPPAAAIAVACPVDGDVVRLTNNSWTIDRSALGFKHMTLLNDFEAVAHAVAALPQGAFEQLAGPDDALPVADVISVVGPGTGLGVAQIIRRDGRPHVVATEGGHIGFAPTTALDDALVAMLRARHGRVSAERIVSGPGLRAIVEVLTGAPSPLDDAALWQAGLGGDGDEPRAAKEFCRCLGAVAGDLALAHGADAVVIAGGLGLRLAGVLPASRFAAAFADKGRFADRMRSIPVKLVTHPQPGLYGAAAAFARKFGA